MTAGFETSRMQDPSDAPDRPSSRWRDAAFATTTLLLLSTICLILGTRKSPDSGTYAAWAGILVKSSFDYSALMSEATSTAPPVLYTGIITVVALCQVLGGSHWGDILVSLNILAFTSCVLITTRLISQLCQSRWASTIGFVLALSCYDMIQWCRYALSDTTYLLIATSVLALLCRNLIGKGPLSEEVPAGSHKFVVAVVALSLVATFYRPTGILLWPCVALGLLEQRRVRVNLTLPTPRTLIAAGLALSALAIAGNAWVMAHPEQFPSSATIGHQVRHYRTGEVVWDRPETWRPPPAGIADYALITISRGAWFWAPWTGAFSTGHIALNLLFFAPCYLLTLLTIVTLIRGGGRWTPGQRTSLWVLLAFIWTTALFHAIIQVDYDWRYRLPVLFPLIVLAACGADQLAESRPWAKRRGLYREGSLEVPRANW